MMLYETGIVVILNAESHHTAYCRSTCHPVNHVFGCMPDKKHGMKGRFFIIIGIIHRCVIHEILPFFLTDNKPVVVDEEVSLLLPDTGDSTFARTGKPAEESAFLSVEHAGGMHHHRIGGENGIMQQNGRHGENQRFKHAVLFFRPDNPAFQSAIQKSSLLNAGLILLVEYPENEVVAPTINLVEF